ncbi:hypothetical protein TNCV_4524381 [Trichonephila clavipes]|nr:hypothetical protein TNCV_4524381 [Trichonephila clavipes]
MVYPLLQNRVRGDFCTRTNQYTFGVQLEGNAGVGVIYLFLTARGNVIKGSVIQVDLPLERVAFLDYCKILIRKPIKCPSFVWLLRKVIRKSEKKLQMEKGKRNCRDKNQFWMKYFAKVIRKPIGYCLGWMSGDGSE